MENFKPSSFEIQISLERRAESWRLSTSGIYSSVKKSRTDRHKLVYSFTSYRFFQFSERSKEENHCDLTSQEKLSLEAALNQH